MAYGLSNGYVNDDVTWPPQVLWGSTVGYPSDSLASCLLLAVSRLVLSTQRVNCASYTHQWDACAILRWLSAIARLHVDYDCD